MCVFCLCCWDLVREDEGQEEEEVNRGLGLGDFVRDLLDDLGVDCPRSMRGVQERYLQTPW